MISNPQTQAIHARLDELTALARARMRESSPEFVSARGGAEFDFMTSEEKQERHSLLLALPSTFEEVHAARERIRLRIASRRASKVSTSDIGRKGDEHLRA